MAVILWQAQTVKRKIIKAKQLQNGKICPTTTEN